MTAVTNNGSVTIAQLQANMSLVIHNPTLATRRFHEHLAEVTSGAVNLVDPSNPFNFLLEANVVSTAAAVDEYNINMRALYPKLAVNEQDLYNHMSDIDYAGRFASCAEANFYFVFGINEIKTKGYEYQPYADSDIPNIASTVYKDAYLPRGSSVYIDGYTFTLEHGIYIRLINDTQLNVFFDTTYSSPLSLLNKKFLEYEIRRDTDGAEWLYFKAPLLQIQDSVQNDIIHRSALFVKSYPFTDSFYFLRAFYRSAENQPWNEFKITFSDIVFDSTVPTLLVKIIGSTVQVSMPLIYNTGLGTDGDIAIHIFTTKGSIATDLSTYLINDYVLNIKDVYGNGELSPFENEATNAAIKMQAFSFSTDIVTSGSNGIGFGTLRNNVINQTLGDRKLPITNVQLSTALISNNGFEIISNTDVLTNRVFLAVKRLPQSVFELIKTSANIGIAATQFNLKPGIINSPFLLLNNDRATLLAEAFFKEMNGIVTMMTEAEKNQEISLVNDAVIANFNNNRYFYNPFYYVLDTTGNDFSISAYSLDDPIAKDISFEKNDRRGDPTNGLVSVHTSNYSLTKSLVNRGYTLTIAATGTTSYIAFATNDFDLNADGDDNVDSWSELLNTQVQVSIFDEVRKVWAYFKPRFKLILPGENTIVFDCEFTTRYDINSDDLICLTNACISTNNEDEQAFVKLGSRIRIVHLATSVNNSALSDFDGTYNLDFLTNSIERTNNLIPYSYETLYVEFGTPLKNMWSRARSTRDTDIYEKYLEDVPAKYTKDVYDPDAPFTITGNNLEFNVLHTAGSDIADTYLHRANEIKLDEHGEPILDLSKRGITRTIDLFFVDAKYLKGNTPEIIAYRNEIRRTVVNWITVELVDLQKELLEQTNIYFYPKTTLSKVNVIVGDNREDLINAEQSFVVDLYVSSRVANDAAIQKDMYNRVVTTLDSYIALEAVSISDISSDIRNQFGIDLKGIKISGLGGAKDYQLVYTKQSYNRLCLKKKVVKRPNNLIDVVEDVTINFLNIEKQLS